MKEKSHTQNMGVLLGILLLGVGLGFGFGQIEKDDPSDTITEEANSGVSTRTITKRSEPGKEESVQSLSQIFAKSGQGARVEGLIAFYENLSADEFASEAEKLQNLPRSERMLASYLLFAKWGELDPTSALKFTKTMGFRGRFMRPTVLQSWAGVDPQGAANHYQANVADFAERGWGRRRSSGNAAASIASEWAKTNPQAALAWTATLTGQERTEAERGIYRQLSSTDPAAAAQKLASSSNPQNREALSEIAGQWGQQNATEAEKWARSLSGDEQTIALARVIESLAKTNLGSAKIKALALPSGEDKDRAIISVASQLSREEPAQAMSYLMENGSENAQRNAISDTMRNWMQEDTPAVAEFLGSLEDGGVRDNAVATYVSEVRGTDPKETVDLAMSIGNDRLRDRTTGRAAAEWLKVDPVAATQFIEDTDVISDRRKRRLLRD